MVVELTMSNGPIWVIRDVSLYDSNQNEAKVRSIFFGWKYLWSCTRKKFILEELPNSSETEDMRKIR